MKISEEQAVDYLEAARELSSLASLLLQQATNNNKKLHTKIEGAAADALYWLWVIITEYCCEEKIKTQINKHEKK